jgi:AraC family transcriptional regulator
MVQPEFCDGRVLHWRTATAALLGEIEYPPGAARGLHAHERACLHLNLEGGYTERIGSRAEECTALAIAFQPAGHEHSYRCRNVATRAFTVEFEQPWLDRLEDAGISPRRELFSDSRLLHLALRLRVEYGTADSASQLVIESLLLEILATASQRWSGGADRHEPAWLARVERMVRARFTETLRLEDLAAEARVHPVHVARSFRAHRGLTIGALLRQLRITRACFLLGKSDLSLAQLALDLGFSDQSQFTKTFRRMTGMTPARYRQVLTQSPQLELTTR